MIDGVSRPDLAVWFLVLLALGIALFAPLSPPDSRSDLVRRAAASSLIGVALGGFFGLALSVLIDIV